MKVETDFKVSILAAWLVEMMHELPRSKNAHVKNHHSTCWFIFVSKLQGGSFGKKVLADFLIMKLSQISIPHPVIFSFFFFFFFFWLKRGQYYRALKKITILVRLI